MPLARFDTTDVPSYARSADERAGDKYVVALNLCRLMPRWLAAIHARSDEARLYLRGGVHFLMEVDRIPRWGKLGRTNIDSRAAIRVEKGIPYTSPFKENTMG